MHRKRGKRERASECYAQPTTEETRYNQIMDGADSPLRSCTGRWMYNGEAILDAWQHPRWTTEAVLGFRSVGLVVARSYDSETGTLEKKLI